MIWTLVRHADTHGWIRWHGQCKNRLKVVEQRPYVARLIFCYELRHARWRLLPVSSAHRLLRYWHQRFCSVQNCRRKIYVFLKQTIRTFYTWVLWEITFITLLFWLTLDFFMFCANIILWATLLWHCYNFCAESPVILDSVKHEEDLYWGWQVSNWCFN